MPEKRSTEGTFSAEQCIELTSLFLRTTTEDVTNRVQQLHQRGLLTDGHYSVGEMETLIRNTWPKDFGQPLRFY